MTMADSMMSVPAEDNQVNRPGWRVLPAIWRVMAEVLALVDFVNSPTR
jgi:hypothetical protein